MGVSDCILVVVVVSRTSNTYHDHDDASLLHYADLTFCEKIGDGTFGIVYRLLLWGQVYRDGGLGL